MCGVFSEYVLEQSVQTIPLVCISFSEQENEKKSFNENDLKHEYKLNKATKELKWKKKNQNQNRIQAKSNRQDNINLKFTPSQNYSKE